jgi:hypothetical protein
LKKITIIILIFPLFIFSQKGKNDFLIIYPSEIKIEETLKGESIIFLKNEKARSLKTEDGKIHKKLKAEVEELTIEKIIGNVTLHTLQYYFYENKPKNRYFIIDVDETQTFEKIAAKSNADFILRYEEIEIFESEITGELKSNFTLIFFDNKDKVYLIKQRFKVDEQNLGGMWGCSDSRFNCIVNNILRVGTEKVANSYWEKIEN